MYALYLKEAVSHLTQLDVMTMCQVYLIVGGFVVKNDPRGAQNSLGAMFL